MKNRLVSKLFGRRGAGAMALLLTLSAVACAEQPVDDRSESIDSELRKLTTAEIVGSIGSGQTVDVVHPGGPSYRALQLQGKAGDKVDIWVRSTDGDAVAILVSDTFKSIAMNDDATPSTSDAHLTKALPATGKYFIVVYERDRQPATFHVSLGGGAAPDAGAGAGDPFPTCDGTPVFPTTGPLYFTSGTSTTFSRSCDAFGVCTPWKRGASMELVPSNGANSLQLTLDGGIYLQARGPIYGADEYDCYSEDKGSGRVSLATGVGEGTMQTWSWCNIRGGSGGPSSHGDTRAVTLKYGASCVAVTDKEPTTRYGVQSRNVTIIRR